MSFPKPTGRTLLPTLVLGVILAYGPHPLPAQVTSASFGPMRARSIGPAGMSGRVTAIDVHPDDRNVIYVGAATGGLWRSRDGGLTWHPVFDEVPVNSIGAVAVSRSRPNVVWVGTGEGNPRNSMGVGRGAWKSTNGGDTWTSVGLEESERIHRVLIHPEDDDVVFAGVMGPAWSDGDQRGVYRTLDGGRTWRRLLFVDQRTGVADLVMDPENPDRLLAAMWEFRRDPWFFESGGEGSGLYLTEDGGESWRRLEPSDGLPPGPLGRIGLAFAPSNPRVVYALVEATRSALLRSDDGGRSWTTVSDAPGVNPRPFYYADLRVDSENENRIYRLHSSMDVSEDGGRNFRTVVPSALIHGDVHELWIDPADGRRMIMGNDGGTAFTTDRGAHWRFVENLPLAQFYHISVDMAVPFNVYGGLQDNGSWYGPMTVWENRGVANAHWRRVGGGDGFAVVADPADGRFGYSLSQGGNLMRFDKVTGARRSIQPIHPDGIPLRFNWNAALSVDPLDASRLYLGSQFVHRSEDRGESWEIISPDLTSNDPGKQRQAVSGGLSLDATGAENHTTILSIAPSPLEKGLVWVSTDDGKVQMTRDDGASWRDLTGRFPGVAAGTWAPHVEPSAHDPAVAYAVFDDHRRGDPEPWVFRTADYGETWRRLPMAGVEGFVHVIEEDPLEPRLLFLGTEFGLHVSVDRGATWMAWKNGLPPAPVRALVVHPRDHDLVIGTHGRAAYILDDVRPLRALASDPTLAASSLRVPPLAPAVQYEDAEGIGYRSTGHAMFFGDARPDGALIQYWVGDGPGIGSARVEILDGAGEAVAGMPATLSPGLNRVLWDLRYDLEDGGEGGPSSIDGPYVLPGDYAVRVTAGDLESVGRVEVRQDPRLEIPIPRRVAQIAAIRAAAHRIAVANRARRRVEGVLRAIAGIRSDLEDGDGGGGPALLEETEALHEELTELHQGLFVGPVCQGICGGEPLASRVREPLGVLNSSLDAPSPNDRLAVLRSEEALDEILARVNGFLTERVSPFRERLLAAGYTPLPSTDPVGR